MLEDGSHNDDDDDRKYITTTIIRTGGDDGDGKGIPNDHYSMRKFRVGPSTFSTMTSAEWMRVQTLTGATTRPLVEVDDDY